MRAIAARVVPIVERRWLAWVVGLAGGIGTFATTMRLVDLDWFGRYVAVGLALFGWNLGMLLAFRSRPVVVTAIVEGASVRIGRSVFRHDDTVAVSVARAEKGWSLAMRSIRAEPVFVEVETEADARSILAALSVPWPGKGKIALTFGRRAVRSVQRASAVIGALGGFEYFVLAGLLDASQYKPIGLVGLVGLLSSVLFVLDPFLRRSLTVGEAAMPGQVAVSKTVARHLALHVSGAVSADEAPRAEEPRVRVFVRGDESTEAWLTRIDTLGSAGEGYRGGAASAEELETLLADEQADDLARLGAARLLVRHDARRLGAIEARLPAEMVPRVRAVITDDPKAAAARLDELGPAFSTSGSGRVAPGDHHRSVRGA